MSDVCKNCHSHKVFGKKCWFYWEEKKTCSQFKKTPEEEPRYETTEEPLPRLPSQ